MVIVNENKMQVTVEITEDLINFFEKKRIYCHEQKHGEPRRWKVGEKLTILKNTNLEPYICYRSGHSLFTLEAFSYSSSIFPLDTHIGRYCSIAGGVKVMGWGHPISSVTSNVLTCVPQIRWVRQAHEDFGIEHFDFVPTPQKSKIHIGHDVWIGQDVLLAKGIKIGTGAIIAAGSVVTKDVEPYAIVGGNKAQLIRYRFDETIRLGLLESKWWEYHFADLHKYDFINPSVFLEQFNKRQNNLLKWNPEPINVYDFLKKID